jgi:hypothetical protein
MIAIANFVKIDEYPMRIELFGTLGEFKEITKNIGKEYLRPQSDFVDAIRRAVDQAEKQIREEIK